MQGQFHSSAFRRECPRESAVTDCVLHEFDSAGAPSLTSLSSLSSHNCTLLMSGVPRPRASRPPLQGPVIVKQWNTVESILNEIGDSWKVLENPHLIDIDTEEPYLQEWNKVAQEYMKETFEMLGLRVVGGSIFVESEYDTFVNYLIGLSKNAASKGERSYPLPTNLVSSIVFRSPYRRPLISHPPSSALHRSAETRVPRRQGVLAIDGKPPNSLRFAMTQMLKSSLISF